MSSTNEFSVILSNLLSADNDLRSAAEVFLYRNMLLLNNNMFNVRPRMRQLPLQTEASICYIL